MQGGISTGEDESALVIPPALAVMERSAMTSALRQHTAHRYGHTVRSPFTVSGEVWRVAAVTLGKSHRDVLR